MDQDSRYRRHNKISGQFAARLVEMLESPAYRVLSLSAHRVINRIEIELAHHGGNDNGRLPVTYEDFEHYGIDRHAIAPAIREVEALGFVVVTVRGRAGNAEHRTSNLFRLTFRHAKGQLGDGTHEWRKIQTIEEAKQIAKSARNTKKKKQKAGGGKRLVSVGETTTEKPESQWGKPPLHVIPEKPSLLSISRGGRADDEQPASQPDRSVLEASTCVGSRLEGDPIGVLLDDSR